MRVTSFVGGRPNLMKAAAVHSGLIKYGIQHVIIDMGIYNKHYGKISYEELMMPKPDFIIDEPKELNYLEYIKLLIPNIENILDRINTNFVFIYGDINPSVAASIAANRKGITTAHIEAGLRNYDITDTEEINRLLIDKFSDIHFCTSEIACQNLLKEKYSHKNIYVVGNTIISTLRSHLSFAANPKFADSIIRGRKYGLVTLHREENLVSNERLVQIINGIEKVQDSVLLLLIEYSSTKKVLKNIDFSSMRNLIRINTTSYHEYLALLSRASFILSDSSGIRDEATYLGIPCVTIRDTTHRNDTTNSKNNRLVKADSEKIFETVKKIISTHPQPAVYPDEWKLDAGSEISNILVNMEK